MQSIVSLWRSVALTIVVTAPLVLVAKTAGATIQSNDLAEPSAREVSNNDSSDDNPDILLNGWWIVVGIASGNSLETADYNRIRSRIQRCGLKAFNDFSSKFQGFAPGFTVFVLGAYASKAEATPVLATAKKCVPDAYLKRGRYLGE